jgi:deoxyribonuclease V
MLPLALPDPWPTDPAEAETVQERLRHRISTAGPGPQRLDTAAGLDVAYDPGSELVVAAISILDARTFHLLDQAVVTGRAAFPYVPGLLAFRELPPLVAAWNALTNADPPDLLVCDGYGLAHPRRFGLACHLGALTGLPTIGVAKTPFVGTYTPVGRERGAWSPLLDGGEEVGRALRTQDGVKEVFVSVGHGVDLDTACRHVLALAPRYRLPETTRAADQAGRRALAEVLGPRS